jgi:lysozyme
MIPGVDVSSFQGEPAQWRAAAGDIQWAAVKLTELSSSRSYVNPDAAGDWAWLRQQGKGKIAYLFGHPATSPALTVAAFAAELGRLGLDSGDAIALDLEVTDGRSPAAVASWASQVLATLQSTFLRRPLLYTFRDFPSAGNCAGLGGYPLWISDPDHLAGHPQVPAPWTTWAMHQWGIRGIDRDVATWSTLTAMRGALGRTPAKKAAVPVKEAEMILVEVDRGSVPKGGAWPGVFLLDAAAALHHVTGPDPDKTNNVESYQKAGIPGPVVISYAEYLARGGQPAVPATA